VGTISVQQVISGVSQDIRQQLSGTAAPGQAILIDYTNRIHKQILRFSRWGFLRSEPQYFITMQGQTDYWIGPKNPATPGLVDTGLNLLDVDRIQKDFVRDMSNTRKLQSLSEQPLGPALTYRSGQSRPGLPKNFVQDHNDVNILHIYPGPDNNNAYQPVPSPPVVQVSPGGALLARTYYVRLTFVDSSTGESVASDTSISRYILPNFLVNVKSPTIPFGANSSGILYNQYNVYIGTVEGGETKQNVTPIAIGTDWTEPTSGLITTGAPPPTNPTVAELEGYIIEFRYYKARTVLTAASQILQIPDDYFDVVVQGVQYLAFKLLGKEKEAQASQSAYREGLTEMVWDKNLFPNTDFIRPDPGSFVNQQILGILPELF
jgi:hypothetical protein